MPSAYTRMGRGAVTHSNHINLQATQYQLHSPVTSTRKFEIEIITSLTPQGFRIKFSININAHNLHNHFYLIFYFSTMILYLYIFQQVFQQNRFTTLCRRHSILLQILHDKIFAKKILTRVCRHLCSVAHSNYVFKLT